MDTLTVEFERRGPSKKRETVKFDLGNDHENRLCAVTHAWNTNARIVRVLPTQGAER